jgi:hypothetical protein
MKTQPQPATKKVAYNPITRRYETVNPEDETTGSKIITLYWCRSLGKYVTVPNERN